MCLGISIVVLFERSPVIDEDKKADTARVWWARGPILYAQFLKNALDLAVHYLL